MVISEDRLREFLRAEVSYFALQEAQSISVKEIIDARTPNLAAALVEQELPVRYAHRIQQIEALPGWNKSKDIAEVHTLYSDAFKELRLLDEMENAEDTSELTHCIARIKKRMQQVIPRLATGMRELQHTQGLSQPFVQEWLDTFLIARIGTEMLTSQYMTTVKPARNGKVKPGIVNYACDPAKICEQAATHAKKLCKQHYFLKDKDNIRIIVETKQHSSVADAENDAIRFPYVPQYLFYIMVEILKNSARASVENKVTDNPIVVTVGADSNQVAIRVSDSAKGIPFKAREKVWAYMYSTASKETDGDFVAVGTPLAGYGVGLPLSRLYARYLGGSLSLMSMPGIGTHAYLYLKRIETEAREEVPSSTSSLNDSYYDSMKYV